MKPEKLSKLEELKLGKGSHASLEAGACIMEMVSYMADEPWSDHPKCACPILTEYAIRMNDKLTDEHRQLMKPFIPLLIGTKENDETQIARKRLIRWRNVTVTYPLILDFLKLPEIASELRLFSNTLKGMEEASKFLSAKRDEIYKSYANANSNSNANTYTYAYAYAYAYANAYANADANAYAYANTNTYAYANTYADANTYAYAYAYAYADADAYAWRDKVVAVALETLRLAIEVKNPEKSESKATE